MKKITPLLLGIFAIIIIGCKQNTTYTTKALREYQAKHLIKETEPMPTELWQALSNEYVVGQQVKPFMVGGKT